MTLIIHVPFVDLAFQWQAIKENARPELDALFDKSAFVLGPYVERFENAAAEYLGVQHAVGVNSGTSSLHLALIAAGIERGDKVLVPAMTFIATAWPLLYLGAIPVLCDVEEATGNIDVRDAARHMEPSVKAIISVHLYGQPADMKAVTEFSKQHDLIIIEDAAQAIGAQVDGRSIGQFGQFGCFSFYPGKNLGAAGEGGLIITDDESAAQRLRALRNHGQVEPYVHSELGFNYRMEGIQGLILYHKLAHLDAWTAVRKNIAKAYLKGLASLGIGLPHVVGGDHVYHLFVIRTKKRDALREHLSARGIQTGLHYPVPLHRQPCLAEFHYDPRAYPMADQYAQEGLSLPMFFGMTNEQVQMVIDEVCEFFNSVGYDELR
ncbi:MAG: DegT/DnrJ/EryC1/StrS family aminotransferase [SAR324 cluster bacterium]|nr:DegT/DnrJ/EryC1/StrS family aminotransferase [SAR324 cluster bacterium]